MTDADLVREAVRLSGLSARRFAMRVLGRHERTIRRWLASDVAIPPNARAFIERFIAMPEPERRETVARLTANPPERLGRTPAEQVKRLQRAQ